MQPKQIPTNHLLFHIIIALVIFTAGCSNSDSNSDESETESIEFEHPHDEFVPHEDEIQIVNATNSIEQVPDENLKQILASSTDSDVPFSIGKQQAKKIELYGDIEDAATDSENNIFLLDAEKPSVNAYNPDGKLLSQYNNNFIEEDSLKLSQPSDIESDSQGNIYISGRYNEIKVLHFDGDSLRYSDSIPIQMVPSDICTMNGKLYLRSVAKNRVQSDSTYFLVHVYSLEDHQYEQGFGAPYQSPRTDTNIKYSGRNSDILCDQNTNTIVYTLRYFPYLYAYSGEGNFKWASEISPFTGFELTETVENGNSVSYRSGVGPIGNLIATIDSFGDQYMIVQIQSQREVRERGIGNINIRNIFLNLDNGEALFETNSISSLLHVDNSNIYTLYNNNENILTTYSYR